MEPRRLPLPEFVAMTAVMFAMLAVSIDSMLPAFPNIAAELTPDEPNRAQLILSIFLLGMGLGTFFTGPLSDAFGRKPVITAGIGVYLAGALLAWHAPTLETLLAARLLQGLGAAAPRVVVMAMVRDLYEGRKMAQITSFVMTVFMVVPAMAPSMGQLIIAGFGWRAIFPSFVVFALFGGLWLNIRQPETLPPPRRRSFSLAAIWGGLTEIAQNRLVMRYIVVVTLGFSQVFTMVTAIQPVYDITFGKAVHFPLWFMATAGIAALGTVVNGMLVMRVGMRQLAITAFGLQSAISVAVALAFWLELVPPTLAFPLFFLWSTSIFFLGGMTMGNLNALALQPMGHIAGLAASIVTAVSTVASALLSIPVAQAFDGTPRPLMTGVAVFGVLGWMLMRGTRDPVDRPA